jgi:prephenate dehydrogenase
MDTTENPDFFQKINHMSFGFIGLGLIGSSIAKALRIKFPNCRIIAFNRSEKARVLALADGVATVVCESVDMRFAECDYIFLCTPVEYNEVYLRTLKNIIKKDCIITDVGSVKANIHRVVIDEGMEENFIGGHPMAGSEKTGYENSSATLCENAIYAITPTSLSTDAKVSEYRGIVESIGAIPMILDYKEHDYSVAAISHVPHIIAAQLVNLVRENDSGLQNMKRMAAGGFKDITRIASSSPEMWEQICMTNTENIANLLDKYIEKLEQAKSYLLTHDGEGINEIFRTSRVYRDSFDS